MVTTMKSLSWGAKLSDAARGSKTYQRSDVDILSIGSEAGTTEERPKYSIDKG